MSEVIQPAAGQTVITTDHDHHRHHGDEHGFRETRLDADFRALVSGAERNATAAQVASCHTDSLVQGGFGGVHDRLSDAQSGIINSVDRGFAADALAACKIGDEIAEVKLAAAVAAKDQIIAQNVGFSAQTVLSTTIGNAANVLATANANAASIQATNNFNLLTVQTERVRAELLASQAAGFAAAALAACQGKADSDAKAAACCCELKALIISEAAAVKQQAADFRMRDLESRLALQRA